MTPAAPSASEPDALRRPDSGVDAVASARAAVRMSRGIAATWWYTAGGILFLEVVLVLVWSSAMIELGRGPGVTVTVAVGGVAWVAATLALLVQYRGGVDAPAETRPRRSLGPLAITALAGAAAGVASGLWMIGVVPLLTAAVLLTWPTGIRRRIVLGATIVIAGLWAIDSHGGLPPSASTWWVVGFYSTSLPMLALLSVWWWDVLVTVDRARKSEGRLAATQERLRVATDVHDLQGHHLQVIALQLELAERLLPVDPVAAAEQLRLARSSVDEARQGTRDLATRFRSVPLRDELANAADLLRAAGVAAEVVVDADTHAAPGEVLGPVIRETTTNVLRHGGGEWARLSLARSGAQWRLEITNDAPGPDTSGLGSARARESDGARGGAGLPGVERRVAEAGGSVDISRARNSFSIVVTVPDRLEGAR